MRPNRSQAVFDATAATYDLDRARLIPGHDAFYSWAVDLIPQNATTILDLGAGSGILTAHIRARFPSAHIHLIDFSAPMLDLARSRLKGDANVAFHQSDYLLDPLPDAGNLCAIVSALSIHHLEDSGKQALLARVHTALKPNGVFINADHIAGSTPALESRYQALWLQQVRANGASQQQVADSLFRQQEDRRAPVEAQLQWLRTAGFVDADCWYKNNCFAVLAGTRTP